MSAGMRPNLLALLFALAASTLLPGFAHGFSFLHTTSGKTATFQRREVVFRVSPRPPAGITVEEAWHAAERALARWSEASGLVLRLEWGEPDAPTGCHSSGLTRNDIVFVERDWRQRKKVVAETLVCIGEETGIIYGADILLNAAEVRFRALPAEAAMSWATEYDLEAVLTHEVGHALGLDHSEVAEAVMHGAGKSGDPAKRELSEDDVVGVQSLYAATADDLQTVGCSAASGGVSLLGLLGLFSLLARPSRGARRAAAHLAADQGR